MENYFKEYQPSDDNLKKITFVNLNNVGRINHTIVNHIVNNWEYLTLNENIILISIPGSIKMNPYKGMYLTRIKKQIVKKSLDEGYYSPRSRIVDINFNYISFRDHESKIYCNVSNSKFIRSEYPSLLDYKKAVIDPLMENNENNTIKQVCYRSMFMVKANNITRNSKKLYEADRPFHYYFYKSQHAFLLENLLQSNSCSHYLL
jgi:hypothetical protein